MHGRLDRITAPFPEQETPTNAVVDAYEVQMQNLDRIGAFLNLCRYPHELGQENLGTTELRKDAADLSRNLRRLLTEYDAELPDWDVYV